MPDPSLSAYMTELFGGDDDVLRAMREEATQEGLPTIQVPVELGRLLQLLIRMTGASSVLEIGTLFGYSGVLMARALPADGTLTTLEVEPKHAALARKNFERAGVAEKATVLEGPALQSLSTLQGRSFDFVLIDADKDTYPQYLDWALRLTHPGSVIVADNLWQRGNVVDPASGDTFASGAAEYTRRIAADSRLTSVLFATNDGNDAASISLVSGRG